MLSTGVSCLKRQTMSIIDEFLRSRRSIRKYKAISPPDALIEQALQPAVFAPSSGNSQPVRFIRINSPDIKSRLQAALEEGRQGFLEQAGKSDKPNKLRNWINAYYRFSTFMFDVPLLLAVGTIAVLPGLSRALSEAGVMIPEKRWKTDADIAVGLALQGIMLRAQELGLGSCVLTAPLAFIARAEEIIGVTDLEIKCFLTLGFPDESPKCPPKKDLTQLYREL